MCLSTVYRLNKENPSDKAARELIVKNAAAVSVEGDKLVFTDIMGIRTVVDASIEKIDLMDNFILVK